MVVIAVVEHVRLNRLELARVVKVMLCRHKTLLPAPWSTVVLFSPFMISIGSESWRQGALVQFVSSCCERESVTELLIRYVSHTHVTWLYLFSFYIFLLFSHLLFEVLEVLILDLCEVVDEELSSHVVNPFIDQSLDGMLLLSEVLDRLSPNIKLYDLVYHPFVFFLCQFLSYAVLGNVKNLISQSVVQKWLSCLLGIFLQLDAESNYLRYLCKYCLLNKLFRYLSHQSCVRALCLYSNWCQW